MAKNKPYAVLFVDDNEVNRYAGGKLLRLAGFDVIEAGTGAEALAALDQAPDIAVVDVHLPDTDGLTLCREIKNSPQHGNLPVLLMSATFTSAADRVQGLEEGADGYLVQPFELPVLRATINSILRTREAEDRARKLSEEWQTTFEAIGDGIWILDARGAVLRANTAMATLWNQPAGSLEGVAATQLMAGAGVASGDIAGLVYIEAPEDGKSVEREVPIGQRWFRVVSHPANTNGDEQRLVQIWTDITARKQAEVERQRLLELEQAARLQAEGANRMKDEFLATLSHELRTPLMAIIGWVELLDTDEMDPERIKAGLEVIERNARTQSQIINDLLDVSRVIAGKMQLQLQPVDLAGVVQSAMDSVRPSVEAKGIHLTNETCGDCPIMGDVDRLQQVLWNLLSNAVKFTPRDGTITVTSRRGEGDTVVLEVQDSGNGIDPKFLPYVFDRFRQADSSSTRRHGGLGLGLAIVRHITEMHGGQVAVTSNGVGQGTRFSLTFPMATATSQDSAQETAASPQPSSGLQGANVLVVDDQEETRILLAAILQHSGAEVECCANARDALSALRNSRPQVLISDIGMPEEDGISLIKKVRMLPQHEGGRIPALALSAYADATHRQKALDAGFHDFAPKPIGPAELVSILTRLLQVAPA